MTKMMDLPVELVRKILSKVPVPVTSLRCLRSTCKIWNDFSKTQVLAKTAGKEFLGFMMMDSRLCSLRFTLQGIRNSEDLVDISINQVSILNQVEISKIYQCDGLVLCVTKDSSSLVLWNPYLGQTRWIQPRTSFHRLDVYALGYGNNLNHKILRFVDYYLSRENKLLLGFEIYDISSNSWRVLDVTQDFEIEFYQRGATVKGNAYYFAQQKLITPIGEGAEDVDTTETEDFLLCFDFTAERFGPRLPLPFHSYFEEVVTFSSVRDEQLVVLHQLWDGSQVLQIWVTNEIDPYSVSWNMFLKVDMAPLTGFTFNLEAASFFIDEEEKVAVVFDLDDERKGSATPSQHAYIIGPDGHMQPRTRYQTAYIIGHDGYFKCVNFQEAKNISKPKPKQVVYWYTNKETGEVISNSKYPEYCVPLVCSSSYVPSVVQLGINQQGN